MPANSAPLIPVVIGVTGHRNIRKEDEQPLYAAVCAQLRALRAHCPSSAITVLSSLAEGADQLCARAAVDEGCALVVPLPFAKTRYVEHFSKEGKQSFDELLALAAHSFVVEPIEQPPVDAGDGFYYRQAGMFIAAHSHALMALWDGVEYLSEDGGGTFETVRFMLEGGAFSPSQNDAYFLPQANGAVWHIVTPREGQELPKNFAPYTLTVLQNEQHAAPLWPETIEHTERFNRDVRAREAEIGAHQTAARTEILGGHDAVQLSPHQQRLLVLFGAADCLSLHFRALRLRALRLLSGLGALLVLVFLLYDEMESNIMLPLYALLLIAAFVAYRVSKRNEYHEKYIQYRLLAEALRVQLYWEMAGVDARVWEQYTWAQQDDVAWVRGALKAMDIAPALERTPLFGALPLIQECWIENQLRYHRAARKKKQLRLQKNGRASFVLLLLSVLLFVLVFALEFIRNDVVLRVIPMEKLAQPLMMHEGQDITVRGALKIVLGIVSAGTALLSNYFSKLSLPVQARDNLRMANLYEMASERLSRLDLTADIQAANKILFHLGREAVVENGNWMLDYLEQAPDIVI